MIRRRIGDRDRSVACVIHVPDAGVVRPGVVVADKRTGARRVVPHDEFGAVRHARERHPDERFAGILPCVNLARKAVRLHVDEADVLVVGPGEVRVVETRRRVVREPHEDGEVREDFRSRVARDGELHAARELGDGRVGARQIGVGV